MTKCSCYDVRKANKLQSCPCGQSHWVTVNEGFCNGTKEQESCRCGGDQSKCDFYESVRARAHSESEETVPYLIQQITKDAEMIDGHGYCDDHVRKNKIIENIHKLENLLKRSDT